MEICRKALGQIPYTAIHENQSGELRLVARAAATASRGSSWITRAEQSQSAEKQLMTIESRPVWPPLFVDSRRHEKIVAHFDARGVLI